MGIVACSKVAPPASANEVEPAEPTVEVAEMPQNIEVFPSKGYVIHTNSLESDDSGEGCLKITEVDRQSLSDRYRLPALDRMDEEASEQYVAPLQVMKRVEALGYDVDAVNYPELHYKATYDKVTNDLSDLTGALADTSDPDVVYGGTTASGLNSVLATAGKGRLVKVTSDELVLDESIVLPSDVRLVGADTRLVPNDEIDKGIIIKDSHDVLVSGFVIDSHDCSCGVFVSQSSRFVIDDMLIRSTASRGIAVIGECDTFIISNSTVDLVGNGPIYIDGDIAYGIVSDNIVTNGVSSGNHAAGVFLGSNEVTDPDEYDLEFKEPDLNEIVDSPHEIVVIDNRLENNNAQGAYVHAAYSCYFVNNLVSDNQKEGICLDYGAIGCYVSACSFTENGSRERIANEEDRYRMLPGLSLDNAAYNVVMNNTFTNNAGTGIKAVRTAVRNLILCNTVVENNVKVNEDKGAHFFGVELASSLIPDKENQPGLDFTPCYENIIARNSIVGAHYAGVFLGKESHANDVFDNVIMGSTNFSIEDHSALFNSTVNNIIDIETLKVGEK